jgi:hypothetical protein
MEQHPVKDSPLGMSGTVNSSHSVRMASRNEPRPWIASSS